MCLIIGRCVFAEDCRQSVGTAKVDYGSWYCRQGWVTVAVHVQGFWRRYRVQSVIFNPLNTFNATWVQSINCSTKARPGSGYGSAHSIGGQTRSSRFVSFVAWDAVRDVLNICIWPLSATNNKLNSSLGPENWFHRKAETVFGRPTSEEGAVDRVTRAFFTEIIILYITCMWVSCTHVYVVLGKWGGQNWPLDIHKGQEEKGGQKKTFLIWLKCVLWPAPTSAPHSVTRPESKLKV